MESKNFPTKYKHKVCEIGSILDKSIINNLTLKKNDADNSFSILVLGGSQGAEIFGKTIPPVIKMIVNKGYNDFQLSDPPMMLFIFLAGPMTVIPLFLYVRGVEYCGLGPTGMIFYITPTLQFLLGYFAYNEPFSTEKLISFILIWIAVFIYLKDLYEKN